ncbi:ethylene-responsive transcription factor ERF084-like [Triticum dicoccoides]|uniref:ethylene-responsive transcription factor ERF084-like n=1 Tax=Triticum dicoccoides TaxID=85692 RepID=UPI00189109EA|nr:ethylene-responsive transcription factor ERF084-like [Triticum dicoccoides]
MPPCRSETWGYCSVRTRPASGFSTEIRFCGMCLGLGNFDTANKAARAYDAATWHLRWPHRTLNFPNVPMRERAQELAPLPRLITDEDRRDNRRREHRLGIAEMDEESMKLWRQRFPQDIINEREFYAQRRAEREKRRAERATYHEDKVREKRMLNSA